MAAAHEAARARGSRGDRTGARLRAAPWLSRRRGGGDPRVRRVNRRTIVLLSLAAFASAASMRVTDAMLPRLAGRFEVGLAQAAQGITVFAIAYGVMQMAFGPLGDRFGKLRVISLAAAGASVATLACYLADNDHAFVWARLF